jgi:excisionase family DNA binding protein/PAS domain S-box-containing protein
MSRSRAEAPRLPVPVGPAEEPAAPSGDVYTMAEAARLKGVSYHTVSRAVRRGKLPAQRLGRMALISAEDLRAWRPMRERAPYKYRRREPNPEATPALLDLASGERVDLARRLSSLYEVLHGAATELPLADFLSLLTDRLAGALDFRRVTLWGVDLNLGEATRLASFGSSFGDDAVTHRLDQLPILESIGDATGAFVIEDASRLTGGPAADAAPVTSLFVAPLRVGERALGALVGDCLGESFELSTEQLGLAQVMANQAALAIEQARLRAAEATRGDQLAAILENIGEAVYACDASGRMTVINAAGRDLLGLDLGSDGPPNDVSAVVAVSQRRTFDGVMLAPEEVPILRALRGEWVRDQRHIVVRPDGRERAVSVTAQPIIGTTDGAIAGAVAVARDISGEREASDLEAQRRAELEAAIARTAAVADVALAVNAGTDIDTVLNTAIAQMTNLLGGAQGAIFFRELDGRMIGQAVYGTAATEIVGITIEPVELPTTMVAFGRRAPLYYTYAEAAPSERIYFDRFGFRSAIIAPLVVSGEMLGVAYVNYETDHQSPTEDDLHFAAALANQCAVAIDKTRLMDRIESAHRRLLAVVDQLPQGVVIVDAPAGRVVLANRAAERLWGAPVSETADPDLPLGDAEGLRFAAGEGPLARTLSTGEGRLGETLTVFRVDGTRVAVMANHAPVVDSTGRIVGAVSVLQDINELRALDRAKDEFLSVAAHELRNPLTSLHGNLQLMLRRLQKDPSQASEVERVQAVLGQSERLAQLVGRMLDISRADLGRLDLALKETNAVAVVTRAVDAAQGITAGRRIVAGGPQQVPVVWDDLRVEQILGNLLSNASKYAPTGDIHVSIEADEETVRITVRDHGPGISGPVKARLFERYFRAGGADGGTAESGGTAIDGLGLGLYVSRTLAQAHGGDLAVADAPGGGTIFTVTLPRNAAASPSGRTAAPATSVVR